MRSMTDTIARLAALREAAARQSGAPSSSRLSEMRMREPNPGSLNAWAYVPNVLASGAALVVVLHGCTQTAAGYDHASAWSLLADRAGFALLFPEQRRSNNPNNCFNWFEPGDLRKGMAEAQSIRSMIRQMTADHAIDQTRIYITGLSAGGAMAAMMLAKYPATFAGGAIIAGLAYGMATTVPEAFDRMRGHGLPSEAALQALLRQASDHRGTWPAISVWQGAADATVDPSNAKAILAQWRDVHGVGAEPTETEKAAGHTRRVWRDPSGRECLEEITVAAMGHGTPLDSKRPGGGTAAPFMLDVGIASTLHIAEFWGLTAKEQPRAGGRSAIHVPDAADFARTDRMPADEPPGPAAAKAGPAAAKAGPAAAEPGSLPSGEAHSKIGRVIEDALRAAGLMR